MKKILALGLPLLVLVGAAITLTLLEARRTPDWESTLNGYIARSRLPDETIHIQAVVEASRPRNFGPAMGKAVGNVSGWPWGANDLPPYPPTALRCVLLERERKSAEGVSGEPNRQVVFVGYHSDGLWHIGWLVHEGPREPFTPELMANLDAVGCDLGLR